MYKKISKILICALILVLAIGAVSAMESDTADDVIAVEPTDDVVAVSNDDADVISVENQDDTIAASQEEAVAVSADDSDVVAVSSDDNKVAVSNAEKKNVVAVSEKDSVIGADNNKKALSLSVSNAKEKLTYTYSKVFNLAKMTFPYKYITYSYKQLPYKMKVLYKAKLKVFIKQYIKSLKKIKISGWLPLSDPVLKVYKKGSVALLVYRLPCYKYA